jgi:hypothetical protein
MEPERERSVEVDIALLNAMCSWAMTARLPTGHRLLNHNPLTASVVNASPMRDGP